MFPIVLWHGDLTPGNVLDGGTERGLVAINPAACLGPAFGAVDLIPWQMIAGRSKTRVERLAAATGMDAERVFGWGLAFAAMNALELASQGDDARAASFVELALQA